MSLPKGTWLTFLMDLSQYRPDARLLSKRVFDELACSPVCTLAVRVQRGIKVSLFSPDTINLSHLPLVSRLDYLQGFAHCPVFLTVDFLSSIYSEFSLTR